MTIEIRYGVVFGKGDGSDWFDWEVELTPEEEIAYKNAIKNEIPLEDVEELQDVLSRAYDEIEETEIENFIDMEDEYVMQCQGELEMDCDELNELITNRDPHAIKFFGLEEATEDELDEWDAYDLDELPLIKDFVEDFNPHSPFSEGWSLLVEFAEPDYFFDDDEEDE